MFQNKARKNPRMLFVVALTLAFLAFSNAELLFAAAPTITTGAVTYFDKTTAELNLSIDSDGDVAISEVGFEYGLTSSYGSSVVTEPFSSDSTDLIFTEGTGNGELSYPEGLAEDSTGNIYVVDWNNDRVQKFNSSGVYQSQFGTPGTAEGQFDNPHGIAFDSIGNIYITDSVNDRVQKFNSSGVFQSMFGWGVDTGANAFEVCTSGCQTGFAGAGNGQFFDPTGIKIDSSGNIFIIDTGNSRVQKFNSSGVYQSQFGTQGAGDGQFQFVFWGGLAIDDFGNIYVADSGNSRVQKFNSSGVYQSQFGTFGYNEGEFDMPLDVEIDEDGYIYVLSGGYIQKFDTSNNFISRNSGAAFNGSGYFMDFFLNSQKEIVIVSRDAHRVFKISQSHIYKAISGLTCGTTYHYRAFATNADGTSYGNDATFTTTACDLPVVETKAVHGLSQTAVYLNGMETDDSVIASTVRGFQYGTTTSYGNILNETPATLSFGEYIGENVSYNISFATAIARDSAGLDYVASKNGNSVQVYDAGSGTLVFGWGVDTGANSFETCGFGCGLPGAGIAGSGDGQFDAPEGVAVDPITGNIYVADTGNDRIQVFNSTGTLIRMFGWGVDTGANAFEVCTSSCQAGISGNGAGQFNAPKSLAITRTNGTTYLYVVDFGNNRIQKLTTLGAMVDEVGGFSTPGSITVSQDNEILLADTGNNRIVSVSAFDLDTEVITLTEPSGWTAVTSPTGVVKDGDNNLIITESGNDRVVFAAPNGNSSQYKYVSAYGSTGAGENQFDTPTSLYLDNSERLVIADSANNRVLQLSPFMSSRLKPLPCNTLYHYRAFATNTDGTGYGSDMTFTTSACGTSTGSGGGPSGPPEGCMDSLAANYDPDAEVDDGSCVYPVYGCTDVFADNFNPVATDDDGTCTYTTPGPGCMNPLATNYNPVATSDNGTCIFPGDDDDDDPPTDDPVPGCADSFADNYNSLATEDDGSCQYTLDDPTDGPSMLGCTNSSATNYNASATTNDGSCIFPESDPPIITTIVEVVEDITGLDRDEQIDVYKGVALGALIIPTVWMMIAERSAIASVILRLWNIIPTLLGFRRRRRPWGTVYDSVTKQPLDPVYVTLRDKAGNEVSTSITDMDGRYGFVTDVGSYVLDAKKGDYTFPSAKLKGQDHDELYEHLYFGEEIDIDKADSIINKNIPMDAVNFNWNEFEKAKNKKLMKFFSRWELFLARIARVVFFAGLVASVMLAFLEPHFWNYAILGLYILIVVLMLSGVKPRQPGFVIERSTGYPLSFAILTVYSAMLKREVAHTIVGKTGKYHVLVPKGRYYIKLQKKTGEQTYEDIYISDEFNVRKGYIDKVIKI